MNIVEHDGRFYFESPSPLPAKVDQVNKIGGFSSLTAAKAWLNVFETMSEVPHAVPQQTAQNPITDNQALADKTEQASAETASGGQLPQTENYSENKFVGDLIVEAFVKLLSSEPRTQKMQFVYEYALDFIARTHKETPDHLQALEDIAAGK